MNQKISLIAGSLLIVSVMTVAGVVINSSASTQNELDVAAATAAFMSSRAPAEPAYTSESGYVKVPEDSVYSFCSDVMSAVEAEESASVKTESLDSASSFDPS